MRVRDGPFAAANESTQAQRPVRALTLISQYIGVFIALMAMVILCGWIFNIPFLKTPFPGVIPMKANAAVCFIFSGTALWLLRTASTVSPAQKIQRYLGYFLALLTAIIGLLTLLEYSFNWNTGLDQLIVKETTVSPGTVYPGRMALYAAVNFLVTGLALLLLEVKSRRHHHPSSYLMIIVGLTGLVAIIGYIYGAGEFVGVPPYTPLALDAAIGFLLLFIGLLLARPTAATFALVAGNYPGSRVISFLIPALIVLVILTGWLRLRGQLMGYYSTELGIAFFSLINIAVATTMIFLVAMRLYTAERRRRRAELEIRELNENLEQQITERTGDLRKSEEKYRLIFENTTEGIFQSTPEGRYISINPAFARIGGFSSPEEMINSVTDIQRQRYVHPEDRTRLMELLTNQGSVNGYEFEIKRHDGTNSWVSINIRAVRDPAGKINYLEGTLVDITERKQAEERLTLSETRHRELFEHMASSVALYEAAENGADFIIRDLNHPAEILEKVQRENVIGRSVRDAFPGVVDFGLFDVFKRVWRTGIPERHPISQYKDSRITGWRDNYVYKLPSGEIVAIYDDVTGRKLNEEALIKSEENYRMLAAYSNQLNDISISLTESSDTKELFSRIADSFRLLTGAVAASFAVFSQEARDLKIVSLSIDPANRDKVNSIFGPELFEMRIPLSADDIGQMFSQAIRRPGDLCELSNGVIPADISDAIMAAIGCRQIVALAITFAEEVIGTCVAYLPENVAVVPDDALKTFIGMAGLAVKRRQSEERLRRFYESGLIGVIFWNMNGQITDANDKFLEMVSYTRDDLVNGRVDWTNMTPPEYRQLDDDSIAELKARGANKNPAEKEYIRKDGTRIPVVMAGATLDDDRSKGLAFVLDITDRKQAEQALRESEEKYRSLFNNAELGMFRSKIDGSGVIEVNDKLCKIIGYSREEILSNPATIRWAKAAVFYEMRQLLRERGVMTDYEFDLINKNGETRTCLGSAKLYPQEGYFEGSVEDITESKKVEEALRSSAIFLNNMVEQSPTPMWIANDKGTLIKVNRSLCELLQVTEEELVGKYNVFNDAMVEEQGCMPQVRNVFEKGEVARFELCYDFSRLKGLPPNENTIVILDITLFPIRDASGKIINAAIQLRDLTERKKVEEALLSSAIFLNNMVEQSPTPTWISNDKGTLIKVNKSLCELLQVTEEELVGKYNLFNDNIVEEQGYMPLVRSVFEKGEVASFELYYDSSRLKGLPLDKTTTLILDVTIFPIRDASGRITNAAIQHIDLTNRKRAEERVLIKTLELERSNTELERFAYVASHDLQEPLRTISSYLQLLERKYKERLDDKGLQYMDFTVSAANRLQGMISGLLEYSRIETQGQPFEPVDCESVLMQTLDNLRHAIDESKAEITHDQLPTVMGDRGQLMRLFQNLLSNSIRYRSQEPPRIHVSAKKQKGEWVFSVKDNGIGIDPEYKDQIFIIFQRLHGRDVPGIGLGLSVAKRIAERHGGRIWLESEPGKGSTFYFTIPVEGGKRK